MKRGAGNAERGTVGGGVPLTILCGDALEQLRTLPDECVQCVVTSPPYWGLRDYGTGRWEGGEASCDHAPVNGRQGKGGQRADRTFTGATPQRDVCSRCGAVRVDRQLGLERTPEEFVGKLVAVFEEVRRVLKKDGTCWVNLGDSYNGSGLSGGTAPAIPGTLSFRGAIGEGKIAAPGLKPKDLVGIPWMVAFALRAAGWWLRADIIWHKPNPMPESVTDRPTKAHEYVFLLTKSERYFYDAEAIKEPVTGGANPRGGGVNPKAKGWKTPDGWDTSKGGGGHGSFHKAGREDGQTGYVHKTRPKQNESFSSAVNGLVEARNKRSVWTVATFPFPEAHFATYPPELVRPCILAGTRPGDLVLDLFAGSGTTLAVALGLGRRALGIELNPEYLPLIEKRCQAGPEFLPLYERGAGNAERGTAPAERGLFNSEAAA